MNRLFINGREADVLRSLNRGVLPPEFYVLDEPGYPVIRPETIERMRRQANGHH
jgi:hypothetical protein